MHDPSQSKYSKPHATWVVALFVYHNAHGLRSADCSWTVLSHYSVQCEMIRCLLGVWESTQSTTCWKGGARKKSWINLAPKTTTRASEYQHAIKYPCVYHGTTYKHKLGRGIQVIYPIAQLIGTWIADYEKMGLEANHPHRPDVKIFWTEGKKHPAPKPYCIDDFGPLNRTSPAFLNLANLH